MTSNRKVEANRANARASTGPRTASGRARASRNALRHGLSLPITSNPGCEEVEALASEIAGTNANTEMLQLARRVAEAQIDLQRVRYARHQLLAQALNKDVRSDFRNVPVNGEAIHGLTKGSAATASPPGPTGDTTSAQESAPTLALEILSQASNKQLNAVDRYERRALLRRKKAIWAFEEHSKKVQI